MKDNQLYKFVPITQEIIDSLGIETHYTLKTHSEKQHSVRGGWIKNNFMEVVHHEILLPFSPKEINDEEIEKLAEAYVSEWGLTVIDARYSSFDAERTFTAGFKSCQQMMVSDAVEFGKWLPFNAVIAEDSYHYLWLKTMKPVTVEQLYEIFKKLK